MKNTKEIWRNCLKMLKDAGCNAIRAAHHVYAEFCLDLCDEMGFYVYEECFDKWTGGLYGRYFEQNWTYNLGAMVRRDRNRPSIVLWGVGNEVENQGQPSMLRILERLTHEVRRLDATRAVGYHDGKEVCSHTLQTPSLAVQLAFAAQTVPLPAEKGYETLLTVRAQDAEGNPYFRESTFVRFPVEGDAEIIGVDNGNMMSHEPYNETGIHMFRGDCFCSNITKTLNLFNRCAFLKETFSFQS